MQETGKQIKDRLTLWGTKLLVKPLKDEKKEKILNGIIIPGSADKTKAIKFEVVVVGVGDGKREMNAQIGDVVIASSFAGSVFNIDDVEYLIINETDVLAVVDKDLNIVWSDVRSWERE